MSLNDYKSGIRFGKKKLNIKHYTCTVYASSFSASLTVPDIIRQEVWQRSRILALYLCVQYIS